MAQSTRDLIDKCFSALAGTDGEKIEAASDAVKHLEPIDELRDRMDAATCVTQATGERWQYYPDLNKLVPSSIVASINDIKEAPAKAEQAFEYENALTIAEGVYSACIQLYADDMVSAMSNQTCVDAFSVNGHPDMPARDEYAKQYLLEEFKDLSEEELAVILELAGSDEPK
jgi:hypothetical protein